MDNVIKFLADVGGECRVGPETLEALTKLAIQMRNDEMRYSVIITDTHLSFPGPTILYASDEVEALTGYKPEELVGKSPRILQGPGTDHATMRNLREACERGDNHQCHAINYRKDGTPFIMCWVVSPITACNKIVCYIAIQSNIAGDQPAELAPAIAKRIEHLSEMIDSAGINLSRRVSKIGHLLDQAAELQEIQCLKT